MRKKIALRCTLLAVAVPLMLPGGAPAATTLGQTFVPDSFGGTCFGGSEWDLVPTGTESGVSYAAPSAGVLTSWSFEAQEAGGPTIMNMRVFRPTGTPDGYTVIADASEPQTIPDGSGLHTFPTRISVQAGDFVGIRATAGQCAHQTGSLADTYGWNYGPLAVGDSAEFSGNSTYIWDVSAKLEPDADQDGFGDESQDQCPMSAGSHGGCPEPPAGPPAAGAGPTGQQAAGLKKCKKKHSKRARRKCRKRAQKLPA